MKNEVNVAAVQMDIVWLDREKNLQRMIELGRQAIQGPPHPDLIVYPELANIGYIKERNIPFGRSYLEKAEPIPGPTTEILGKFAHEHGVYIVVGLCEKHPQICGTVYNSAVLIAPSGEVLGVYRKMHIGGEEKHYFYGGNKSEVFKTELGNIGMVICYDLRFPELSRILALKGAEIITCSYNAMVHGFTGPHVPRRLEVFASARAMENQVYVIACDRIGTQEERGFVGHSTIVSPTGEVLAVASDDREEIIKATFTNDELIGSRHYRPVFQDRHPEHYGLLVEPT